MNSPSIDIKDVLEEDSSLMLTFAQDLFVAKQPHSPDHTVTVYDTSGREPLATFEKGENYYYESIQVRIRNNDYKEAYSEGMGIMNLLHVMSQQDINGTLYTVIRCVVTPHLLEWDDKNRAIIIVNFQIQRR